MVFRRPASLRPVFSSEFKFYLLLPVLLLVAWLRPRWGRGLFLGAERRLAQLGNRRRLAVFLVGGIGFIAGGVPSWIRMPAPKIHDEFSYLLAADTFSHGRVTNPTPRFWEHFESIHIIERPTYMSKYPPGQGALLAIGQILWRPILGVWLGLALAAAAICWMLQAWLPPRWAFFGGLLAALHPQMITWGYNYCGGTVAAIGGALLARGVKELVDTSRKGAWTLGLGLFVLANSRPYEGLITSVFVLASGVILVAQNGWAACRRALRYAVLPLMVCALGIAAWVGFYDYCVTGDPQLMPYTVHVRQYMVAPIFLGQSFRPEPVYRSREIREFHTVSEVDLMGSKKTLAGNLLLKAGAQAQGWLWTGLWLPLVLLVPWRPLRDPWYRAALVCLGGLCAGLLVGPGIFPHYAAPGLALFLFVIVQQLRRLRLWQRHRGVGVSFVGWLCLVCVCTVPVVWGRLLHKNAEGWYRDRERVVAELEAMPGKQLVFMRYGPEHNPNREWVYNESDLEQTKVLWSREIDPASDAEVIQHYDGRTVWVVEADGAFPKPVPYPARDASGG